MRIRRGIVICAAIISIMACTACGNSGEGVSGANGNVTSTGENSLHCWGLPDAERLRF